MGYKVMQIETSNYCSLKCIYRPHPAQHRPKGDMTFETFAKCMTLVQRSDNPVHVDGRKFVWLNERSPENYEPKGLVARDFAAANKLRTRS